MSGLIILSVLILGMLFGIECTIVWYYKEYEKLLNEVKAQNTRMDELEKRIDELSYIKPEEPPTAEKFPCINTPDGVINYLRAKYMPDRCN